MRVGGEGGVHSWFWMVEGWCRESCCFIFDLEVMQKLAWIVKVTGESGVRCRLHLIFQRSCSPLQQLSSIIHIKVFVHNRVLLLTFLGLLSLLLSLTATSSTRADGTITECFELLPARRKATCLGGLSQAYGI